MGKKRGKARKGKAIRFEEVSSGSKPIEGVGTAVAAFVGLAAVGVMVVWLLGRRRSVEPLETYRPDSV